MHTLALYSASAGSGKTHALTRFYIELALRQPSAFRNILAVTFTNKATREMKNRIIEVLYANSRQADPELAKATGLKEEELEKRAGRTLMEILHHYSWFSVGTIDSFFQRVIRAFVHELHLPGSLQVRLDGDRILEEATDLLFRQLNEDESLRSWFLQFTRRKVEEGRNWNVREDLLLFGREVLKEKFHTLKERQESFANSERMYEISRILYQRLQALQQEVSEKARRALEVCSSYGLGLEDFYGKGKGVYGAFVVWAEGEMKDAGKNVLKAQSDFENWYSGKTAPAGMEEAYRYGLDTLLEQILQLLEKYNSLQQALRHINALGISRQILSNMHLIASEANSLLLSDAARMIHRLIGADQIPFIYEKIGTRYHHYLIDEFQDTSRIQWENFQPLISEAMASGKQSLLVGDVKQSIYRWRNSDWRILGEEVQQEYPEEQWEKFYLRRNYRSRPEIVQFNNELFSVLPAVFDRVLSENVPERKEMMPMKEVYRDVVQETHRSPGGWVRVSTIPGDHFAGESMAETHRQIQEILRHGYELKDIGILVRESKQSRELALFLMNKGLDVLSSESLFLRNSSAVQLVICVLNCFSDPGNRYFKTRLLYLYQEIRQDSALLFERNSFFTKETLEVVYEKQFGELFGRLNARSSFSGFYTLVQYIIQWFELDHLQGQQPFLNAFMDAVQEFLQAENGEVEAFLRWWDTEQDKRTIRQPGEKEAIQIMTIHKAKGLKFPVVFIPFPDWDLVPRRKYEEVLWVNSGTEPLRELGTFPVTFNSKLKDTFFSREFADELHATYLDSLNMLYVACTRAAEGLLMMLPEKPGKKTTAALLLEALQESELMALTDGYFAAGAMTPCRQDEKEKVPEVEVIRDLRAVRGSPFHLIRTRTHEDFSQQSDDLQDHITRGRQLHEFFSGLENREDLKERLEEFFRRGLMNQQETADFYKQLQTALGKEPVKSWFHSEATVHSEQSILLPGGGIRRPDRVVEWEGTVRVIDYKFGKKKTEAHKKQVRDYVQLLQEMGYENVRGYLWYFALDEVVMVSGG